MKNNSYTLCPLSPAHLVGVGAFQFSILLLFFYPDFAIVPLIFFLILCFTAPFFPGSSFFLPVVSKGSRLERKVCLTFDDGPDPEITPLVLELLKKHEVKAAFFVVGKKADEQQDLIKNIISDGHEIGNHSYNHDPLVMLKSPGKLDREIFETNEVLKKFGISPLIFRPPVGITNPRLWRELLKSGMFCVNFSCRAFDMGNRFISNLSKKILNKVKPGDIILLHDIKPHDISKSDFLIIEIEKIIIGLKERNFEIAPLSNLIKKPVMIYDKRALDPVSSFYNSLAERYDEEQATPEVSPARKVEVGLFEKNFLPKVDVSHNILELGAGTGRFTVPISEKCREIHALDISENMIKILESKIKDKKIDNIKPMVHDVLNIQDDETFDSFCSFSSIEYISDISSIIKKGYNLLKPGGEIYFITANRSILRFFIQMGNAMRQGVWLHARGKREIARKLEKSGFSDIRVSTYGLKSLFFRGILLEARAKK